MALITFSFLALLVLSELMHVRGIDRVFEFGVDDGKTFSSLSINIDIDINTPCERTLLHYIQQTFELALNDYMLV